MNLIFVNKTMNKMIPDKIILTWKNKNIPDYILKNIKAINPDKEILFFDDDNIIEFLSKEYDNSYVEFFQSIKNGYNKGDFFRYCYLYKYGGYYFDIDIEHVLSINNIVEKNLSFFSIISCLSYGHIFQAMLWTKPQHPIIYKCIYDMFHFGPNPPITPSYIGHTTTCMFNNISQYLHTIPKHGLYKSDQETIQLGQEKKINNRFACFFNDKLIGFSRYENYDRTNGFY